MTRSGLIFVSRAWPNSAVGSRVSLTAAATRPMVPRGRLKFLSLITCVYNAPDEQTLREHAVRGNFPANAITRISGVIDPITEEGKSS